MKTLFTTDYKNYEPAWPRSCRPSARGIIIVESESQKSKSLAETSNSNGLPPLSPNDKIALAYAKNLGYYKFSGGK